MDDSIGVVDLESSPGVTVVVNPGACGKDSGGNVIHSSLPVSYGSVSNAPGYGIATITGSANVTYDTANAPVTVSAVSYPGGVRISLGASWTFGTAPPPDTTSPVITLNGSASVYWTIGDPAWTDPSATATDNVDSTVSVVVSGAVDWATPGTYTLTYDASDSAGNPAVSVTRTVVLKAAPVTEAFSFSLKVDGSLGAVDFESPEGTAVTVTSADGLNGDGVPFGGLVFGANEVVLSERGIVSINGNAEVTYESTAGTFTVNAVAYPGGVILQSWTFGTASSPTYALTVDGGTGSGDYVAGSVVPIAANPASAGFAFDYWDGDTTGIADASAASTTITTQASAATVTARLKDVGEPVITLTGFNPVEVAQYDTYMDAGATALDNLDGDITANIAVVNPVDTAFPDTYTVTYNVSDAAGNPAVEVTRTVVVKVVPDTTPPVITLNGASTVNLTVGDTWTDPWATATDNVDTTVTVWVTGSVDLSTPGTYTLTYYATDAAGNAATSVTRTVIVSAAPDTSPPVITLNGSATVDWTIGDPAWSDPGATATGNVDTTVAVVVTGSVDWTTPGTYTLTYDATDAAANKATPVTRTVTVKAAPDTTPPVITLTGSATVEWTIGDPIWTDPGATATDNVDTAVAVVVTGSVDWAIPGTYTLTYSATDAAGNPATPVTRSVTVKAAPDTTPPVITLNGASTVDWTIGDPAWTDPGATATDNVDPTVSVVVSGSVDWTIPGTYTLTYSASDVAGNAATPVTRDVTVKPATDTTAPVITLNGSATVDWTIGDPVWTDPGATATDNVDPTVSVVVSGSVDWTTPGTYTLTYSASDAAGNPATPVTRSVTVKAAPDTTAPVITLTGSATVEWTIGDPTWSDPGATATDNVDPTVAVVVTGSVDWATPGTYTLTYSATDAAGNVATPVTRDVTVKPAPDTTAPVITLNGSASVDWTIGDPAWTDPGATATDNVDPTVSVVVTGSVDWTTPGTYTLTYSASDAAGNPATPVTRTVTVKAAPDTTPPVITLTGSATVEWTIGDPTWSDPGATATDNVGPVVAVVVSGSVDWTTPGTYTLTYSASDAAGNPATPVTRTVNVKAAPDTTPPVITLNGSATVEWTISDPTWADPGATATDNVDPSVAVVVSGSVDWTTPGTYTLTYSATDAAGNPAIPVTRTVNVKAAPDTIPPVITLNGPATVNLTVGDTWIDPWATATDNVDVTVMLWVSGLVDVSTSGTYVLTYDATDAAGNAATSVTRTVIVSDAPDTTPPVITLFGASLVHLSVGDVHVDAGASAVDDTDGDISTNIVVTGSVDTSTPGTYILTHDVSDAAGNAAVSVTRTVIVSAVPDVVAPVVTVLGALLVNLTVGDTWSDPGATAMDNVDGSVTVVVSGVVDVTTPGTYVLTYTATDAAGNVAASVTRTVIVAAVTPPVTDVVTGATILSTVGRGGPLQWAVALLALGVALAIYRRRTQ